MSDMADVLGKIIASVDEANNWDSSPEMYQKYGHAILAAGFRPVREAREEGWRTGYEQGWQDGQTAERTGEDFGPHRPNPYRQDT